MQNEVDKKYFLSQKSINHVIKKEGVYTGINEKIARCITTRYSASIAGTFLMYNDKKYRKLTPRECFRLMDFPDTFTWVVSDSQAYKQAGNSIVVGVLTKILSILLC